MVTVTLATDAGHPGRSNEDFAGAVPCGLVLVDGAGGIAGADEVCHHGIAWYATRLGGALLGALAEERSLRDVLAEERSLRDVLAEERSLRDVLAEERSLRDVLAEGVERVTDAHRDTCDVAHPISPFAAVAMLRFSDDLVEHLVLGDAVAVVGRTTGEPVVAHDPREVVIARSFEERLKDVPEGGDEYRRLLMELRSRRNSPGGFWVAKDDPTVVDEAVTGSGPADGVTVAALLSNGASRLVDTFGLTDWPGLLRLLETDGPAEVIHRVRQAEAREGVATDDATIVCRL